MASTARYSGGGDLDDKCPVRKLVKNMGNGWGPWLLCTTLGYNPARAGPTGAMVVSAPIVTQVNDPARPVQSNAFGAFRLLQFNQWT